MHKVRIYQPGSYQVGDEVQLNEFASHHLAVVLRKSIGNDICIFPSDNFDYTATITAIKKKAVTVKINLKIPNTLASPLNIHLAQAVCKGDKMDWILQKATELGVTEFTPIISARSVDIMAAPKQEKKLKHWQNVIIHATEQCGRAVLPKLNPPQTLDAFVVTQANIAHKWLLNPEAQTTIKAISTLKDDITLLIGPEGGWSDMELETTKAADIKHICLGPRVLRTETAPIVSIAILQFLAGDLG